MIPLYKTYMPENITAGIENILYSGKLSFGEIGKKFEKKIETYLDVDNVLTISSYNQALMIVISCLGLEPGDEIIASPVSCLASNQPFAVKRLKVVWADIDPQTGTLLIDDVRSKITSNTKAIFHNHHCGYLGEIDEMNALGKEFGIPIIDDCIEAFGSELNGSKAGNLGTDITVFSFQTIRLPNTIEGAAIVFNCDKMYGKAKLMRDYGIDRDNFRDNLNEINPLCDVLLEGYGGLLGEVNSFIGIKQLENLDLLLKTQRNNGLMWDEIIGHEKSLKPLLPVKNSIPNRWVYGLFSDNKIQTIKNFREKGYYASSVHMNNNIYTVFGNKTSLQGVKYFMDHFVALPCGWWFNLNEKI
jgi:perosamine synthetase